MKNLYRFAGFLFVLSILVLPALAQDDTVKTFEVRLPVTVKDKKKNLVSGLTKNDFIVLEDGVPQEVTFFTTEKSNPPVYVGVLMDTSSSTKGKLGFSKEAAMNFIYTVIQQRKDKAAFMTFDHEVSLKQDFTDKQDLLQRAVDKVKKVGSQTALYDAIWEFSDQKMRSCSGQTGDRFDYRRRRYIQPRLYRRRD